MKQLLGGLFVPRNDVAKGEYEINRHIAIESPFSKKRLPMATAMALIALCWLPPSLDSPEHFRPTTTSSAVEPEMARPFPSFVDSGIIHQISKPFEESEVGADQFALGQLYESAGRMEDAEKAYLEALKSDSKEIREDALSALARVIERRRGSRVKNAAKAALTFVFIPLLSPLSAAFSIAGGALLVFLSFRVLTRIGTRRGTGKLQLMQFADSTEGKYTQNFREIVSSTLAQMHVLYGRRRPVLYSKLPAVMVEADPEGIASAISEIVPEGARPLTGLLRGFVKAEYSLHGSLQHQDGHLNIVARLEKRGLPTKRWDKEFSLADMFNAEKDLAYEILLFLKKEMSR